MAGYYGFILAVCPFVHKAICHTSVFLFPDDNLSKYKWIVTKLAMCIVEIWFWIANGQISSGFDSYLSATQPHFHIRMISSVNVDVCIDIMEIWFGITKMDKFCQFLKELLAWTHPYFPFWTLT